MKKVVSIIFVLFLVAGFTNAQTGKMKLGIGPYVGFPMGSFGDATNIGFGGVAQGEYEFSPQVIGTVTAGYLSFSGKSQTISGVSVDYGTWSIIPIWVGAKYYFNPNFYGVANLGLNMISYKIPGFTYSYFGYTYSTPEQSVSDTKFGFQIGLGYDMGNLDFSARYGSYASDVSAISVMALYKFPLN